MSNAVLLFNPWSARYGYRIPNSVLQVAASIKDQRPYLIVDGNREKNPWERLKKELESGKYRYFGCTVMPGPQLNQAIPFTKKIRNTFPHIKIIWGGYFASNQYQTVLDSGLVDFIIDGPADHAFPQLLAALDKNEEVSEIVNLIYKEDQIIKTKKEAIPNMESLPPLPYEDLFKTYSADGYLKRTFLGKRTAAYHSSFGCPFTCSFCAVVPIYKARWKGLSASRISDDLRFLQDKYEIDAVEFHDNNFFVSQERTKEFSKLILDRNLQWWGEGRIDTIDRYTDESLELMRKAGCRMIFFGAESGNDDVLQNMDKGGTQNAKQIADFAARMKQFDIIPEYSFVLGLPGKTDQEVMNQIDKEIEFIKKIKDINPDTEIIIYIYSPVPTEGSELYEDVKKSGFRFPEHLDEWLQEQWQHFDERKNPMTPWLKPHMVDKIRDFETVLNGYSPSVSDFKLSDFQRNTISKIASFRYKKEFYRFPYEIKALQKFWLKYRQPEVEGMYME